MMATTRFLHTIYLCIVLFGTFAEAIDLIAKEIYLLDQIDKSQVIEGLITTVDQVLNNYISDQMSVESKRIRVTIWNQLPSERMLEPYFDQNFKLIKYDQTYRDLSTKKFDFTRFQALSQERTWEKFAFLRVQDEFITLFFSYTRKSSIWDYLPFTNTVDSRLEDFFSNVFKRMCNKLSHPSKSLYSHGSSLVNDKSVAQYRLVYHDNRDGYVERHISSYDDGLQEQAKFDQRKLSSCILMSKDGQTSLHSIRHPIIPGYILPDFHAYYEMQIPKQHSTVHQDL